LSQKRIVRNAKTWDVTKAQQLLDGGMSLASCAKAFGIGAQTLLNRGCRSNPLNKTRLGSTPLSSIIKLEYRGVKPLDLCGCEESLSWSCHLCEYTWISSKKRRSRGDGCPKCAGNSPNTTKFPVLLKSTMDLATVSNYTPISWACDKGHTFISTKKSVYAAFKNGTPGCPYCSNCAKTVDRLTTLAPALLEAATKGDLTGAQLWGHRGIDFADMLYLPVTANVPFDAGADVVFVDELQDLDALQRRMVVSMARTGALFVGVGDTSQAIFGFRGADCDSMRKVRQETTAVELPLSICYRCPTSHIELARLVAPQIEARDGAPVGLLEVYNAEGKQVCNAPNKHGFDCTCKLMQRGSLTAAAFQPGDLVLSRMGAPLVTSAYWLIRHGVACHILGKDASKLLAYIDSFRVQNIDELITRINRAVARAGEDDDVEDITDRRDVIAAVADACESNDVAELRTKLTHLFSDNTDRASVVTLSTIHRAKGAEADRVWWIDRQQLSLDKNFKHEWRREEEKSIIFVGSTRSRRELRFVCSEFMR